MPRRVLITGATGFVGSALARAAAAQGWDVRAMGRNFSQGVVGEPIRADLRDAATVAAACAGVDTVFHVGALSSPWGDPAEFHAVNVGGTENVLAGCRAHGVRHIVHVSSPSVVFTGRDHVDTPDDAPYPARFTSVYAQTKKLAEDRVNAALSERLSGVILRPKAVFGPGDTSLLPRLAAAARAGRLPRIGDGRNRVELTYIDNVVDALLLAADPPEGARGRTFTITNGEPILLWEVVARALAAQGIAWTPRPLPTALALLVAGAMEARARRTGREPLLTRYTVQLLARTQTYDTTPARDVLGYAPRVSLDEGLRRTFHHHENRGGSQACGQ